jgi:hypothetical protein
VTGPEHYRQAERMLGEFARAIDGQTTLTTPEQSLAQAHVHATLALAVHDHDAWRAVAATRADAGDGAR